MDAPCQAHAVVSDTAPPRSPERCEPGVPDPPSATCQHSLGCAFRSILPLARPADFHLRLLTPPLERAPAHSFGAIWNGSPSKGLWETCFPSDPKPSNQKQSDPAVQLICMK